MPEPTSFAAALAQDQPPAPGPDLRQKTASLHVSYTDSRGKVYDADFTNTILTISQRIAVDVARARMSQGVTPEAMGPRPYGLLFALCWMQTSITAGPDWIKKLGDSTEENLVEALWTEVSRHEDTFFGRDVSPA